MPTSSDFLSSLEPALKAELEQYAIQKQIPAQTEMVREGAYLSSVPIVLSGKIKVFRRTEDKELLLYYIQSGQSCVMSFFSSLRQSPSEIVAITEEDSEILLLPADKLASWMQGYPSLSRFLLDLYHTRFSELLHMVDQLLFWKMDDRIWEYLQEKSQSTTDNILHITHQEISHDLGTAREVVSRILKKWEGEGKVALKRNIIQLL